MSASVRPGSRRLGPPSHLGALPLIAATELVATIRCALWPIAKVVHPLPTPPLGDQRPPVVLVHGFLGHPDMFRPLQRRLYEAGFGLVERVHYPIFGLPLDRIVARIEDVAAPLAARHGRVDLVGHSLGAVACRAWIKRFGGDRWVRRFVSLAGPHGGTSLFRVVPEPLRDVLDPEGPWVRKLQEGAEPVPTTVIRSRYDHQVVPPYRAALSGAREIVLTGYGHNGLLWSRQAHDAVIEVLTAPG
jgi:pimeloyl-ACP methyl ester carboxylesterase